MAVVQIWEEGEVKCRADGLPKDASSCEFVFFDKDGNEVGRVDAALVASEGLARSEARGGTGDGLGGRRRAGAISAPRSGSKTALATWKAPKCADDVTMTALTYKLEVDGLVKAGFVQDVHVWARKLTVTSLDLGGLPLPHAAFSVTQRNPRDASGVATLHRRTDDSGVFELDLVFPASATIAWESPFAFKEWTEGSDVEGRKRTAKVEQGFVAILVFPDPNVDPDPDPRPAKERKEGQHVQWVNRTDDGTHPGWGSKITIKVGAANPATVNVGAAKAYLKAKWDSKLVERKTGALTPLDTAKGIAPVDAAWPTKDKEHKAEKLLDASKEATFELELGPAGGDKVVVEVGGTSECKDAKVEIVNWRMLRYEVCAPADLALEDVTLPDGTAGRGLPKKMTDWFLARLAKAFVYYVQHGDAHTYDETDAVMGVAMYPSEYVKRKQGTHVSIPGDWGPAPTGFTSADVTIIQMSVVDYVMEKAGKYTPKLTLKKAKLKLNVNKEYRGDHCFAKSMDYETSGGGDTSITAATWVAMVDPAKYPAGHPGLDGAPATPRSGNLDVATDFAFLDWNELEVTLPAGPAAFVGSASKTKCPVQVKFTIVTAEPYNGNAGGGSQTMVFSRPPQAVGATVCHELGHSMGMTVFAGRAKPPLGFPYPERVATVDENDAKIYASGTDAGLVYDNTVMHVGSHCAFGISASDRKKYRFNGKSGKCVMFGAGGNEVPPPRDSYCVQCLEHVKARRLTDVHTRYDARGNDEL